MFIHCYFKIKMIQYCRSSEKRNIKKRMYHGICMKFHYAEHGVYAAKT